MAVPFLFCSTNYIHCNADNSTYTVLELSKVSTPYGVFVPQVRCSAAFGNTPGGADRLHRQPKHRPGS